MLLSRVFRTSRVERTGGSRSAWRQMRRQRRLPPVAHPSCLGHRRDSGVGKRIRFAVSLVAWVAVWGFWFLTTRKFHPTAALAFIVTTALVAAYATAAYLNHLILLPRLWQVGRRWRYLATLP